MNESEKKVVALKIEFIEKADGDSSERVVHTCYDTLKEYPDEQLDYGEYWEVDECGGRLWIYAEDGNEIFVQDAERLFDYAEGDAGDAFDRIFGLVKNPGDWAEAECDSCYTAKGRGRIRITGLAEFPRISPEKTIANSDLSLKQLSVVRVYGKPLFAEGGVMADNCVWTPWVGENIRSAVKSYFANLFGTFVEVSVNGIDGMKNSIPLDYIVIDITADSEEDLRRALSNAMVSEPDKIRIWAKSGDEKSGRVHAKIHLKSSI